MDVMIFLPMLFVGGTFLALALSSRRRRTAALVAMAVVVGATALFVMRSVLNRPTASEAIKSVQLRPVQVNENIVVVDLTTDIERWSAEVRAGLVGPRLAWSVDAHTRADVAPIVPSTLVTPVEADGNATWRPHSAGRQTWRVGFVLPTAELAQEAFNHLQPLRPFTNSAGAGQGTTLFTVRGTNGAEYRAEIEVAPVLHSGKSNWVQVMGRSSRSSDTMVLTWQMQASREGFMRVTRGGGVSAAPLQRDAQSQLHEAEVQLELHRLGANRTLLTRKVSGNFTKSQSSEELGGDFRELSAELLRTAAFSAKTVRGARVELGQVAGESIFAQVLDKPALGGPGAPVSDPARTPPSARAGSETGAPTEVSSAEGGLSLFSPVVGAGIVTNEFHAVTTVVRARHVGVLGVEFESAEGIVALPELSYHAVSLDALVPFATLAKWTVQTNADGRIHFQLHVAAQALNWSATSQPVDLWNDYVWTATRPNRSHWVGPGEWHLNDTNALTIFEGVKRDDPNQRATLRLKFSLFALPQNFVPAQRGRFVRFGTQWRVGLGVGAEVPFNVTPLTLAAPSVTTVPARTVFLGVPWITLLLGLAVLGVLGVGGVGLVLLLRRRSVPAALKVLAVLVSVALLLLLLIGGALILYRFMARSVPPAVQVH